VTLPAPVYESPLPPPRPATRRARNAAAKGERRAEILKAALELLAEHAYDEVTMAQVARRGGLAKGTVYLYFDSKEAVFLSALLDRAEDWFSELQSELELVATTELERALPDLLARTLAARPLLIRLFGLLHTTLEENIGLELAQVFKHRLADQMAGPATLLEAGLPGLCPGDGVRLLMRVHALVVGLGQMAHPSPTVARALESPELGLFRIDFERELSEVLRILLRGWEAS
jgi:AcrR family transcriptional regulator